jgi:microcystin degradation protein MlrC
MHFVLRRVAESITEKAGLQLPLGRTTTSKLLPLSVILTSRRFTLHPRLFPI